MLVRVEDVRGVVGSFEVYSRAQAYPPRGRSGASARIPSNEASEVCIVGLARPFAEGRFS
jgi:hypothetical protein